VSRSKKQYCVLSQICLLCPVRTLSWAFKNFFKHPATQLNIILLCLLLTNCLDLCFKSVKFGEILEIFSEVQNIIGNNAFFDKCFVFNSTCSSLFFLLQAYILIYNFAFARYYWVTGKEPLTYYDMNLSAQDHQVMFRSNVPV